MNETEKLLQEVGSELNWRDTVANDLRAALTDDQLAELVENCETIVMALRVIKDRMFELCDYDEDEVKQISPYQHTVEALVFSRRAVQDIERLERTFNDHPKSLTCRPGL